jgi:hypothetical protein
MKERKLDAKIINFGITSPIDIHIDIDIGIHIEEKFEKQEKWGLSAIDIHSLSAMKHFSKSITGKILQPIVFLFSCLFII